MNYDETKFFLGKLCKYNHAWSESGFGLRYLSTKGCVECVKVWRKKYSAIPEKQILIRGLKRKGYQKNRSKQLERMKEFRKTENFKNSVRKSQAKNKPKAIKRTKEWRAANPEKVAISYKRYCIENRGKIRARNARRSKRVKQALPRWANLQAIEQIYIEARKLELETGIVHHVDHIYPLISELVCGLHVENNLQILTATANLQKGNKMR